MNWRDYWNQDTPIFVGERHKLLHYKLMADEILALIPAPDAVVLDHGCGEALFADRVARTLRRLYLCDAAPIVRERVARRFRDEPRIAVLAPEDMDTVPDASLDLVVSHSLVQYLSLAELRDLLRLWRAKLKPDGRLVVADVIPHEVSPATDATALLSFALKGGFLKDALVGLARTALSDYRRLRNEIGLSHYDEAEMAEILEEAGFAPESRPCNIGHNQARLTFVAHPVADRGPPPSPTEGTG